jgi:hypothetical protein
VIAERFPEALGHWMSRSDWQGLAARHSLFDDFFYFCPDRKKANLTNRLNTRLDRRAGNFDAR